MEHKSIDQLTETEMQQQVLKIAESKNRNGRSLWDEYFIVSAASMDSSKISESAHAHLYTLARETYKKCLDELEK